MIKKIKKTPERKPKHEQRELRLKPTCHTNTTF